MPASGLAASPNPSEGPIAACDETTETDYDFA